MNTEQQRIEIAKACGWLRISSQTLDGVRPCDAKKLETTHEAELFPLPDYLNDLNACHEMEKVLTHDQWRIYLGFVMGERTIPKLASMEEFHRAWNATAAQRSEAFLLTIGKWTEQ